MHKSYLWVGALTLAAAIVSPVSAATTANVIKYQAVLTDPTQCAGTGGPGTHGYVEMVNNLAYAVKDGDKLAYDVLVDTSSTLNAGAVDLLHNDSAPGGGTLRDSWAMDQYGRFAHPGTDLSREPVGNDGKPLFVRGQWFHREIALTASGFPIINPKFTVISEDPAGHLLDGATITDWALSFDEHDSTHEQAPCPLDTKNTNVVFYIRNVNILDKTGAIKLPLFNGEAKLPGGQDSLTGKSGDTINNGYGLPAGTASVTIAIAPDPVVSATRPTAGE